MLKNDVDNAESINRRKFVLKKECQNKDLTKM